MPRSTLALAAALAALALPAAFPAAGAQPIVVAEAAAKDLSEAEVRKVDKATGKITLKHGEIRNLGMPPMTMVFPVKDPKLLDKVAPGDKVKFRAEASGGMPVVTALEKAK